MQLSKTANLAKLAYGSDPLRWDILDTLKLLACLVEQFGGSINLTGSDLTQGQLRIDFARRLTAASFIGVGRAIQRTQGVLQA